jgi:segregation and condensation protein A
MKHLESTIFHLENFEGPLDFLLHLIQKEEMDIYEVPIRSLMAQYREKFEEQQDSVVDEGAEFIASTAALLWLKSKTLLPKHEQIETDEIEEEDPRFEVIHHLIDYCRFKEAAQELAEREQKQSRYYSRGAESPEAKKNLGIEHLSLEDLASLFQQLLIKSASKRGIVKEEEWKVGDKVQFIKEQLRMGQSIYLETLFLADMCREELIVTFLAILELMKLGQGKVGKETSTGKFLIYTYASEL